MGTTKSPITPREQVPYNYKNVARHRGSRVDRACAAKKTKQKEMDGKVGEGLMKRKEGKGEEKKLRALCFFSSKFSALPNSHTSTHGRRFGERSESVV